MATSFQPAQLDRFRREAKKLCREFSILHSEALDRIAVKNGFPNWSLLTKHSTGASTAPAVLRAAAQAVDAHDTREAVRSPFHRWLDGQRDRNDPIGDLAKDILRDVTFPTSLSTRRELDEYLARFGIHVTKSFRQAWREFNGGKPPALSLADTLAAALKITRAEAEELVDVEPQEVTGHSGDGVYGFEFDFTGHASPKLAAKLMQKHRSLKIRVGPWFYDGIQDGDFLR
jgi:uncharacterized protein YozE (UPF0346 family)